VVSPEVSRGFLAVVPPDDVLDAVEAAMHGVDLPVAARRTTRSNLHLTVRFLGNRVDFPEVESTLRDLPLGGGQVRLGGAGAFPKARRGDVLWLGLADGDALLTELAGTVDAALDPQRPSTEPRPRFHAHLTVARCKTPTNLRPVVDAIGSDPVGRSWTMDEMVLIQSRLGRGPAHYEERARFPLES
jgi:RNA 2',3'-cyclic 3'-phosphodiesterase